MAQAITRYLDLIGQQLTSAPMWIQVAVVLAGAVPLCLALAFILLRGIDIAGARMYRLFNGQTLQQGHRGALGGRDAGGRDAGGDFAPRRSRRPDYKPGGSRIVINEEPS